MKYLFLTLFLALPFNSLASSNQSAWQKSPELEAVIANLKHFYASTDSSINIKNMKRFDNLSYFLLHIDEKGTPEYIQLKAFLLGLQQGYEVSISQQIQTNITPWFCPPGGQLDLPSPHSENPTLFIENLIYEALERDIKNNPNGIKKGNKAFMRTTGVVSYGLQVKYPCYDKVPLPHRQKAWVY